MNDEELDPSIQQLFADARRDLPWRLREVADADGDLFCLCFCQRLLANGFHKVFYGTFVEFV